LVAVGTVFFIVSPLIALIAFTPIPVIVLGAFYFQRRAQPLYADVRGRVGLLGGRLSANIAGITTIKSFATEKFEADRVAQDSAAYVQANRKAIAVSSAFIPIIRMAILAGFAATFMMGGFMVLNETLAVGAYGVLVFLTQRLLWPLTNLAQTVDLFERAMASTRRLLDLISTPVDVRDEGQTRLPRPVRGEVVLEQVGFRYGSGGGGIEDVSLTIPAGTTLALVGATGSGKSTLIKLLLRFYRPAQGRLLIDGIPIEQLPLAELRGAIGLVSQDVFLFEGSIRDNIAYGRPDAEDAEVIAAARTAEAWEFIERLPQGLHTPVGERGVKLSGGQRQRLSLARALLKDPPI